MAPFLDGCFFKATSWGSMRDLGNGARLQKMQAITHFRKREGQPGKTICRPFISPYVTLGRCASSFLGSAPRMSAIPNSPGRGACALQISRNWQKNQKCYRGLAHSLLLCSFSICLNNVSTIHFAEDPEYTINTEENNWTQQFFAIFVPEYTRNKVAYKTSKKQNILTVNLNFSVLVSLKNEEKQ